MLKLAEADHHYLNSDLFKSFINMLGSTKHAPPFRPKSSIPCLLLFSVKCCWRS
jgi:hypothetical protein